MIYEQYQPEDIDPAYKQDAIAACLAAIAHQANIDKQRNGGIW